MVNISELNRPGVMSSYSSKTKKKNNIHSSKNQVAGATFNQARLNKASSSLHASRAGHVGANRLSNGTPRYWTGQEATSLFNANRGSGQITSLNTSSFASRMGMPMMPNMGATNPLDAISALTSVGLGVLDKLGVFDKKPVSNGETLENSLKSLGGNSNYSPASSEVALTLSNMASCNDAASLSRAIDTAKGQLSTLDTQIDVYDKAASEAKTQLNTLETQQKVADKDKADKQQSVSTCEGSVSSMKTTRDSALEQYKTGNEAYDNALKDYTVAHDAKVEAQNAQSLAQTKVDTAGENLNKANAAVADAQNTYDNCKEDGPQKAMLKAKLDHAKAVQQQAHTAKNEADRNLTEAEQKLEDATTKESQTLEAKNTAYNSLGDLKTKADEANKALDKEQQKLDKAQNNLEKAQENLVKAESKVADLANQIESEGSAITLAKQAKSDRASLKSAISSQEDRLKHLQKNEKKQAKIDAKENKTKGTDEDS